ncbi:MAG: IS4 family transposase, partial [Leptolyngbya sp. SIO1D8]|nr:IS4 family transposase [Leptolyngbya sp. SIO1D8]
MTTIFVVCGKVNDTNLSRYSELSERTYRRHFEEGIGLNQRLIEQVRRDQSPQIALVDCTFLEKSGRHTYGLDWFYNGKTQRAEKGLELSVIAIVDVAQNTGYLLSVCWTESK